MGIVPEMALSQLVDIPVHPAPFPPLIPITDSIVRPSPQVSLTEGKERGGKLAGTRLLNTLSFPAIFTSRSMDARSRSTACRFRADAGGPFCAVYRHPPVGLGRLHEPAPAGLRDRHLGSFQHDRRRGDHIRTDYIAGKAKVEE